MPWINYRNESRKNYGKNESSGNATVEELNCGSLLRIADATELMSTNWTKVTSDLEKYKRLYDSERAINMSLERSNSALRGVITKLKKQLNQR